MLNDVLRYLKTDLWRIRLRSLTPVRAFLLRHLRILVLTVREAAKDRCLLRASALTFFSLLSIGPVIALAMGIAKGFGLQNHLVRSLQTNLPVQPEVLAQILQYAEILLENTRGGVIVGVGIAVLLWSALRVFNHLERSFNEIWQVEESRSWRKKVSNYLAFLFLAPLFLLIYSSIPTFVTSQLDELSQKISLLARVSPVIIDLLQVFPYLLAWLLFPIVYLLIPNTPVRPVSGILAGVLAGTVYLMVQWGLIEFQVSVTRYNPIYGSLLALPLLLLWIQLGWLTMLFGAEYAYAHQNVDLYELEPDFTNISPHYKKLLTLQILHRMVQRFRQGEAPLKAGQVSQQLEIPIRLVQQILDELDEAGLVSKINADDDSQPAFQPSSDIHLWTIRYVNDALNRRGVNHLPVAQTDTLQAIEHALEKLDAEMEGSDANRLLLDI